jgi:hypothetical protein
LISLMYINSLPGGFNFHSDSAVFMHLTDSGVEIGACTQATNNIGCIDIDPGSLKAHRIVLELKAGLVANYA